MSTPHSGRIRRRLSTKLHTPGSAFGIRKRGREEVEPATDTHTQYTFRPERLYFTIQDDIDTVDDYEGLEDLIGKTWKIYRVSPLHNFEYSTVQLKQYGRRLREGLATMLTDSAKYSYLDVNFSVAEGIAMTENDSQAIRIMVNIVTRKNGEDSRSKYYIGFLVCRGASHILEEESTIHLPVLLCKGTVRTSRSVNFLLQKFFDCSIAEYQLSQEDLAWICALQADETDTRKETSQVEMIFSFPQLSMKNSVHFKIPLKCLRYLWNRIHRQNSEYASFKEVRRYYEALQQQLAHVFQFNIAYGQLVRIKTPTLSITNETRLMAKTGVVLNYVLKILYEGTAIIDSSAPTLGVQPG